MNPANLQEANPPNESTAKEYYTFRVRKRSLHGLVAVAFVWFVWSQGAEVADLFHRFFLALT